MFQKPYQQSATVKLPARIVVSVHTGIPANGTSKVSVYWASETIVTKGIACNTSRAEILRGEHAPCRHNAN